MELKVDSLKCTGCRICEFACNYHQDESISPIGSSLMFYFEEKKNYYGMMVKREKTLYLGRPEGDQMLKPGEQIEVDFDSGILKCEAGEFSFPPLPVEVVGIVEAGGLIPYIRKKLNIED